MSKSLGSIINRDALCNVVIAKRSWHRNWPLFFCNFYPCNSNGRIYREFNTLPPARLIWFKLAKLLRAFLASPTLAFLFDYRHFLSRDRASFPEFVRAENEKIGKEGRRTIDQKIFAGFFLWEEKSGNNVAALSNVVSVKSIFDKLPNKSQTFAKIRRTFNLITNSPTNCEKIYRLLWSIEERKKGDLWVRERVDRIQKGREK